MSETPISIDFETVRLLTQVGLLASWCGAHEQAATILSGASAWSPDVAQIRNCHGLALMMAGRSNEAVELLTDTTERHPDDEMARATLAFVLKQLDRPSWRTVAETVGLWGQSQEAVWLARHTLGLDPDAEAAEQADAHAVPALNASL